MALPDYGGAMSRNQVQRQRQKEKTQKQKVRKSTATTPVAGTPYQQPVSGQQEDYKINTGAGYQGVYTAPSGSSNNPYYDPNASYAQQGDQYYRPADGSELQQLGYDDDPAGYYYGQLNKMGYGGTDARSQAAQGMYKQYQLGYSTAKTNNNWNLHWDEYMGDQDITNRLEMMSDEELGIDRSRFGGRDRWQLRGNY